MRSNEATPLSSQATTSPSMMQLGAQTGQRIYDYSIARSPRRRAAGKDSGTVGKRFRGLEVSQPDWSQITGTVPARGDYFVFVASYPGRPRSLEKISGSRPSHTPGLSLFLKPARWACRAPQRKAPLVAGLELRRRGLAYPASLRSSSSG